MTLRGPYKRMMVKSKKVKATNEIENGKKIGV